MKNIKPGRWYGYILLFLPVILFFIRYINETDIWFLFSHGKEVLTNGFPHVEFLSMHQNFHFIMPQWLSAITFYSIYKISGFFGIFLLLFIILLIMIFLVYKLCMIISNNKNYASCIITAITVSLYELLFLTPRPNIFTYLILIGVLIILELYINNKKDLLYLLPILSIIQINFHASMWPVFFIFIMPFIVELLIDLIHKKNNKIYKLLIIILISILVGIINPYGIENMTYSIKSYGNIYINIMVKEMQSFNLNGECKGLGLCLIFLYSLINIILINRGKNKVKIHELLLINGTFIMAILNIRNYGLFYIASFPFITKYINIKDSKSNNKPIILYILLSIILLVVIILFIKDKKYIIKNKNEKIVSYLNKNTTKDIKIYTSYNDGAYLEYFGYRPYIDARAEVYTKKINKKEDIMEEYYYFYYYPNKYFKKFDNKYKFEYYLVDKEDKDLIKILKKNNFKEVYKTNKKNLYKR